MRTHSQLPARSLTIQELKFNMPKEHERPEMFAPSETRRPRSESANEQPLTRHLAVPRKESRRGALGRYHHDLHLQQSQGRQLTTSQQSRNARTNRRTSQIVNGVVYTGSVAPTSITTSSQSTSGDSTRDRDANDGLPSLLGCEPINPDSQYLPRQPNVSHPQSSSAARPQIQVSPPTLAPRRYQPTDRSRPNTLSHYYPVSGPPYALDSAPGATPWAMQLNHQTTTPHRDPHYTTQIPPPPVELPVVERPLELEAGADGIPPLELEAGADGVQQYELPAEIAESPVEIPVLEEQKPAAPVYEFFTGARTWEFEDLSEVYGKLLEEETAARCRYD
ncbi:hypothetical protein C7974DRAFT_440742 [Boeremia exigua]|uniref:uncharacterized protein n=1 Tax=Boeremia exigua TaxID=749465 RepID=UPI001E8D1356|nr:uncharacterized protein C7974DRAFT_440742 [Boeremia exigua]KAH6618498.1 hypothetical protein C7974DRAFT_440742 [Boeremia exigua]